MMVVGLLTNPPAFRILLFMVLFACVVSSGILRFPSTYTYFWVIMGTRNPTDEQRGLMQTSFINANYSIATEIACTMKAHKEGALLHSFEDGFCGLYGIGLVRNASAGPVNLSYDIGDFPYKTYLEDLEEVAQNKDTYCSGESSPTYGMGYAVDGSLTTLFASKVEYNPWLLVDLGEERLIYQIQIFPQSGYLRYLEVRYGNELITTGNFSTYTLAHYLDGFYRDTHKSYSCSFLKGVVARYISLQCMAKTMVHLTELKIYALKK